MADGPVGLDLPNRVYYPANLARFAAKRTKRISAFELLLCGIFGIPVHQLHTDELLGQLVITALAL
ncbi:hypothetical protein CISG_02594 [Coccidioides immitis RMSCC 3703]|uniref:Uncharacterized protein n=1 Tax=Coccidioides immitis RMSCC 3703 TaxID=454286 RepID=A0A0J8U3C1_COCIT|nr:hypothetical protein CISG_02594 [Coccidioides immitis RMSCC 3703]